MSTPVVAAARGVAVVSTRVAVLLIAALLVAGCGSPSNGPVSFDPGTACASQADEGHFAGAYPDLEAMLPSRYGDKAPDTLDSGRSCTPDSLGTLAERGITQIRFAGANWDLGNGAALTVAVFEGVGLDQDRLLEFYEAGARAAQRTNDLKLSDARVGDAPARRLDVLFGTSTQTIVAWPNASGAGRVSAVLASDLGDSKVAELLGTLATSATTSPSP